MLEDLCSLALHPWTEEVMVCRGGISALAEGVIAAAEEMRVVKDAMTARRNV